MHRLIIRHARQIVQVCSNKELLINDAKLMKTISTMESDDVTKGYSVIVDVDGNIFDLGEDERISEKYAGVQFEREIDARGKCVMPGKNA